jgi:hypothetical protein
MILKMCIYTSIVLSYFVYYLTIVLHCISIFHNFIFINSFLVYAVHLAKCI